MVKVQIYKPVGKLLQINVTDGKKPITKQH
jgi:hypothetical protein